MNKVLSRLKNTAKLEALIAANADYDKILRQSQKIDKYIVEEMKRINERETAK
jgi:hypothetical protein